MADANRKLIILAGGGPAPGINGVIASVTQAALRRGMTVLGCRDGFKNLVAGRTDHIRELTADEVAVFQLKGGSMLGTARTNPAAKDEHMQALLGVFDKLGVTDMVTVGGDDTAFSASQVYKRSGGKVRVAHVPKTIDNDLPLPPGIPTFGFQTARHFGVEIVRALHEDARTTSRWYVVVSMGRAAGHLALGIGSGSAAELTVISEEYRGGKVTLDNVCDRVIASILKQKFNGKEYGVAILAEGLIESIGEAGLLDALGGEDKLSRYGNVVRDPHGHLRLGEIEFGRIVKDRLTAMLAEMNIKITFIEKDLGYELRCIDPIPFDAEYTRNLGYGAVKFLHSPEAEKFGAIISYAGESLVPLAFEDMIDPATSRMRPRIVDVDSAAFECARGYMARLEAGDLAGDRLTELAGLASMTPEAFKARFEPVAG